MCVNMITFESFQYIAYWAVSRLQGGSAAMQWKSTYMAYHTGVTAQSPLAAKFNSFSLPFMILF